MKALVVLSLLVSVNAFATQNANEELEQQWNTEEIASEKVLGVGNCEVYQDALTAGIVRGSISVSVCERVKVKTIGRFKLLDKKKWGGLRYEREDRLLGESEISRMRVVTKITGTVYAREGQSSLIERMNAQTTCEAHKEALTRQSKTDARDKETLECMTQAMGNQP